MSNYVYLSDFHGCAYQLVDDTLCMTPLHDDLTYDTCTDNWVEVDFMALLGEDIIHQDYTNTVYNKLVSLRDSD